MLKTELLELIRNGESSGVEFKRDDIDARKLARELVAFANASGGGVLLGVEDDGTVVGKENQDSRCLYRAGRQVRHAIRDAPILTGQVRSSVSPLIHQAK